MTVEGTNEVENTNGVIEFEDIDLSSFNFKVARAGNETMKVIDAFLNTGKYAAVVKLGGELNSKRAIGITQTARHYVKPVRAIYRDGKMVLKRVDITQEGNAVPNWEQGEEFLGDANRREAAQRAGATRRQKTAEQKAAEDAAAQEPVAASSGRRSAS
jgi:hypothetical protein